MDGRSSIIPIFKEIARELDRRFFAHHVIMYHVGCSFTARDQNTFGSNPPHMMEDPPERIGASKFRIIPPTWKSGIIFTTLELAYIRVPQA
jgi:hypothetical protein